MKSARKKRRELASFACKKNIEWWMKDYSTHSFILILCKFDGFHFKRNSDMKEQVFRIHFCPAVCLAQHVPSLSSCVVHWASNCLWCWREINNLLFSVLVGSSMGFWLHWQQYSSFEERLWVRFFKAEWTSFPPPPLNLNWDWCVCLLWFLYVWISKDFITKKKQFPKIWFQL